MFQLTDNGEGMDNDTLERVFDPFFTTKDQGRGTGLGLSVSYGIIKEHGGKIYAQSRPGEGSTFLIEFPVYREEQAADSAPQTATLDLEAANGAGHRILVVDDEPTILDLFFDILESAGYRVDTASNGVEAAQKVAQNSYDVVVTDVRMPQMSGIQLHAEILSKSPALAERMIFVTGDLIDPDTTAFVDRIGARTIAKPLEIQQVLCSIEAVLDAAPELEPVG